MIDLYQLYHAHSISDFEDTRDKISQLIRVTIQTGFVTSILAVASHVAHRSQETLSILVLASRAVRGLSLPRAPALVNHAAPNLVLPSSLAEGSRVVPGLVSL